MGNEQTYGQDPTLHSKTLDTEENYQIFESSAGEEFEKYIVLNDGSPNFQNNYEFRIENKHPNLVDIVYAGPSKNNFGCAEITKYEIVTERMPYRLNNLSAVQPQNALIILRATLTGFRDIFKKHGLISVKDNMIGINNHNKVKVWLNHNFSINNPEQKPMSLQNLQIKDHERQMVHNIFDLINSKTEHQQMWSDLIHLKQAKNPTSFDQSLSLINLYMNSKHINIGEEVHNLFNKMYFNQSSQKGNIYVREEQSYLVQDKVKNYPRVFRANSETFYSDIEPKFIKKNDNLHLNNQVMNHQNGVPFQNNVLKYKKINVIQNNMIPEIKTNSLIQPSRNQPLSQPHILFQRPPQKAQMIKQTHIHTNVIELPRNNSPNIIPINRLNNNNPNILQNHQPVQQNYVIIPQQGKINIKFNTKNGPAQPISFSKIVNASLNQQPIVSIQRKAAQEICKKGEETFSVQPIEALIQFDQNIIGQGQSQKKDKQQKKLIATQIDVDSKAKKQVILTSSKEQEQVKKEVRQNDKIAVPPKVEVENSKEADQSNPILSIKQPAYSVQVNQISSEHSKDEIIHNEQINLPQYQEDKEQIQMSCPIVVNIHKEKSEKLTYSQHDSQSQNIQMLKTVVNASLVDTKEIKRSQPHPSQDMKFFKRNTLKDVNRISYRSMRQMLLQELND